MGGAEIFTRLLIDRRGGVVTYAALAATLGIGSGAVAIDFGRLELLRTQMQHAADSSAIAAVTLLNGSDGARDRATAVATNSMQKISTMVGGSAGAELSVAGVQFYSQYNPPVAATSDLDAKVVEVTLAPQTANLLLGPVLSLMSGSVLDTWTLNAKAAAQIRPFVCHAPPLMMCDLREDDPAKDPTLAANIGKQVRLKEPEGTKATWVPGNFGLLALPDGSSGATDIEAALAAVEPQDCYQIDVITATGSKTNKVKEGINTRFDISTMSDPPAPNVINYPRDATLISSTTERLGNGVWDSAGYWTAKHGGSVPAALVGASRYQVYLYELGLTFARKGKETLYPIPGGGIPTGFTEVDPPAASVPVNGAHSTDPDYDGVPQHTPASNGEARRRVQVALLQCIADEVKGHGEYPTYGKYVEMFITETVKDPPNAAIYGEIIRSMTTATDPSFHANATLVK